MSFLYGDLAGPFVQDWSDFNGERKRQPKQPYESLPPGWAEKYRQSAIERAERQAKEEREHLDRCAADREAIARHQEALMEADRALSEADRKGEDDMYQVLIGWMSGEHQYPPW